MKGLCNDTNGEPAQGGYGKICIIPAAGPTEGRTFRYCANGAGRQTDDTEQLQQCGGQYVERLLYLRIADAQI